MRRGVSIVMGLIAALALLTGVGTATAQDGPILSVRAIDAADPSAVHVTFTYVGDRNDLTDLVVRDGGRVVKASTAVPLAEQQAQALVLVIDASTSMNQGALIERVLDAARSFVAAKTATDQIAIVSFNSGARVLQGFTTDKTALSKAIDKVSLGPDTALYDGIVRAFALFQDTSLQPNVIVFSDGGDTASTSSAARARASVENAGGALFAIGVENSGFKVLADIASATGGSSAIAGDPAGVGVLFEDVQATLRKQYVVTFASRATSGAQALTMTVGTAQVAAEYVARSSQGGAASLRPQVVEKPGGPALLRGSSGLILGLVLVLVAVAAAVASLGNTFLGREHTLLRALRPYSEDYVAAEGGDDDDDGRAKQYAETPLVQRAISATGNFAETQGYLTKVERKLERADLSLRPAEAIFFYLAGVAVVALLLVALASDLLVALMGAGIVAVIPPAVLSFLARRRQKKFDSLLPDTLQLLASTLRAGYSLMQGVEAVSQEVSEPVGRELRRVVTEARLGRPLEESLDGVAERLDSADFAWAVMAVRIQREVGGNLAELLVTVGDTMTERERLRRDVAALTAEGKVSAVVLGVLPIGIGGFIYFANPGYLDPLFDEVLGQIMLFGSFILAGAGFLWMKKIIEIEI